MHQEIEMFTNACLPQNSEISEHVIHIDIKAINQNIQQQYLQQKVLQESRDSINISESGMESNRRDESLQEIQLLTHTDIVGEDMSPVEPEMVEMNID